MDVVRYGTHFNVLTQICRECCSQICQFDSKIYADFTIYGMKTSDNPAPFKILMAYGTFLQGPRTTITSKTAITDTKKFES